MNEPLVLEVFFDYICPWCYLGSANTDRLRRELEVEMRWTLFPLHPEIPEEGMELADLFRGSFFDIEAMQDRLQEAAGQVGLPIVRRSRISNSRRAQELDKWAGSLGRGDAFRRAVFHGYFAEGRDIARISELEDIAFLAGLPGNEVRAVLGEGRFAGDVDADWMRARQLAITAVPFYLYGEKPLVGFRPYEDFLSLLGKG
jgi:predicted DsbA family dithiol-disulfide isomerase